MKRLTGIVLFLILTGFTTQLQTGEVEEYNLKAAFIYNFTKYISWSLSETNVGSPGTELEFAL